MKKITLILFAGLLLVLNIFAWQEVFVLNEPHYLKVHFLSVGQGDSAFIETPDNHQILIDGGPNSLVLEKINNIMPFGDKTIDVIILTHPEKDHMTGILDVLQRYKVDYFLHTGVFKNNAENKKLAQILDNLKKSKNVLAGLTQSQKTKVMSISAGDKIKAGQVLIDVLSPLENLEGQELKEGANVNNTSVVNRVIYGINSFLFTGDIDIKTEKQLVNLYNLKSNVLKVAHHGSKYSTSDVFLQEVAPEFAVIEVGKNSYGHPTTEVLNRLENFGIQIKRTDKDGDIKFLSDGSIIKLEN